MYFGTTFQNDISDRFLKKSGYAFRFIMRQKRPCMHIQIYF